jgi:hypothetical protein
MSSIENKLKLVDEQTSPLFRIMNVYNSDEPARRQFDNNICAFHIGNGYFLSVAHHLRSESGLPKVITEQNFQENVISRLDSNERMAMEQWFFLDDYTGKRHLNIQDQQAAQAAADQLSRIQFDTRWISLMNQNLCKPFLILNFSDNLFYNDPVLTAMFSSSNTFHEPGISRYSFLVELEFVHAFYSQDIAVYRVSNTNKDVVNRIPFVEIDDNIYEEGHDNYYCLQSAPGGALGRLLNTAVIEGYLDHHGIFPDRIGGNYIFDGTRYLIKGYFRFGSSGAPYIVYNQSDKTFKANAIQSEASPIQLSIKNDREGNFQYINAIATPLRNIITELNNIRND